MNTWNTPPESYQQWVYNNTLATVKSQIQQAENPTPAVVISVEAARVDNAILLDYLDSAVVLEKPEIGITDPNIPIDNNSTDYEHRFGMPGVVLATVPDRHFGSGSGSKPNRRQIGGPGRQ